MTADVVKFTDAGVCAMGQYSLGNYVIQDRIME
jgi:hypothetical protein